jgi:hypothetical protein
MSHCTCEYFVQMIREQDLACSEYLTHAVEYVKAVPAKLRYVLREGHSSHGRSLVLVSDREGEEWMMSRRIGSYLRCRSMQCRIDADSRDR